MKTETLFTPADFQTLAGRDLSRSTCVVFDVLRATSSMITALANGARSIIPVGDIPEALEWHRRSPEVILAGERQGLRIRADLTGSVDFHLGNSPREFVRETVAGKQIVMTTTNGTRGLRACAAAKEVLVGSFLNLGATAQHLLNATPEHLVLVCSGTFEESAYEDVLGAGALCTRLATTVGREDWCDSTNLAHRAFVSEQADLMAAWQRSRNARRLLANPELRADVPFCFQTDAMPIVAIRRQDAVVRMDV